MDRLLDTTEVADYLGIPVNSLKMWRYRRTGRRGSSSDATSVTAKRLLNGGWTGKKVRSVRDI
jgi:hypothetical protein